MELTSLAIVLAPLLLALLFLWYNGKSRKPRNSAAEATVVERSAVAGSSSSSNVASTSSGTSRRMRRRPAAAASSSAVDRDQEQEEEAEEAVHMPKASKKELKKQEKESRKQANAAAIEHRNEKQDRQSQLRRERDEEREAEEQRKEEELLILKEKEQVAAVEEFDKWKDSFSVDTEGTAGEDTEEGKSLVQDFVDYVKKHKCVALEDLAAEFHLRTQECINRIVSLEQLGRLSGVMDDRGKFIYISPEEMKAVADYIKRQGRVSISHLSRKSNEFIDLESRELAEQAIEVQ